MSAAVTNNAVQQITDADRWAFIRDRLATPVNGTRNGEQTFWSFRPIYQCSGATIADCVDAAILKERDR